MKENNIKLENFWKFLALLCLGILIGIFSAKFVLAGDWPLPRDATCNLFNLTGIDCERYWCEHVNDCNYSTEKTMCICYENTTIVYVNDSNMTNNFTIMNYTFNQSMFNETKDYCVNYTDYMIKALRDSMLNNTQTFVNSPNNQNGTYYYNNSSEQFPAWGYVVIVCVIVVSVAFIVYSSTSFKKKFPQSRSLNRDFTKANDLQKTE